MKHNKKGQSALEFIMTYGWAILVVLVMIGALAYFGVLNPKSYLPEKCLATAGFSCADFQMRDNIGSGVGNMTLLTTLTNQEGTTIQIQGINATFTRGSTTYTDLNCGLGTIPTSSYATNAQILLSCGMGPGSSPGVGQLVTVFVALVYKDPQGIYNHTANLQVQAKTQ